MAMKVKSRGLLARSLTMAVFLIVGLGLLAFPGGASAAETTEVSISAPIEAIEPGEQFSIGVVVVPNTAIAGMQFDLQFDPSLFAVDSVTEGDLLTQGAASTFFNAGSIDNEAGVIRGAYGAITSPGETVSAQGTFATVILTAKEQSESCPVSLSSVIVGDIDGNSVPVSLSNEDSLSAGAQRPVFRWWVLSVIVGTALTLSAATTVGVLVRRRQMLQALERERATHIQ
jgi:hypothetical protein